MSSSVDDRRPVSAADPSLSAVQTRVSPDRLSTVSADAVPAVPSGARRRRRRRPGNEDSAQVRSRQSNDAFQRQEIRYARDEATVHLESRVLEWQHEPARYIFFVTLLIFTIISLLPQAGVEWTTSILSMSRRLSIFYSSVDETTKPEISKASKRLIRCRHYLLALFIGFQEGYLFGSVTKVGQRVACACDALLIVSSMQFDVTCLFGLRHTIETLMVYGCGATLASALFPLLVKRISLMVGARRATLAE